MRFHFFQSLPHVRNAGTGASNIAHSPLNNRIHIQVRHGSARNAREDVEPAAIRQVLYEGGDRDQGQDVVESSIVRKSLKLSVKRCLTDFVWVDGDQIPSASRGILAEPIRHALQPFRVYVRCHNSSRWIWELNC